MEVVLDHRRRRHQQEEEEEASTCSYSKEGFSVPYFATQIRDEGLIQIHAYASENKRVFRFKKVHSIRNRGRSSPFTSIARKLDRFKVRYILVQDAPPNDNH